MTVDEVTERLKEIGPHVFYKTMSAGDGYGMHIWRVQETPAGPQKHIAVLSFSYAINSPGSDMAIEDIDALMAEGKRKSWRAFPCSSQPMDTPSG